MITDAAYYAAMKAQEAALITASKPGMYELGMKAYRVAQRIIDRWDQQQIEIFNKRGLR